MAEVPKCQFKSVQLLKDQSLGIGSYGTVCKAKCDDLLLCAAKIIHPTLFDPTALQQVAPQREHRLPIRRFEQECEFMSAIRHPNIVQYLGMFRDTDTRLPVLPIELMDDSLTHFLESSTQPIPYHIQVNICHDVSLALSFLHSNKIVHRDLFSNNVLLIGNVRAKVTDFGMARLSDINPQATRFTSIYGDQIYMLGGTEDNCYCNSAYTCSVSALLQSCVLSSLEAKFQKTFLEDKAGVWRRIADLPVIRSTCESFHSRLLAVGGIESGKDTTAVYMYNSTTNSWEIISHMTTGRRLCFTAVLPDNRLMVVGGYNELFHTIDSVELATVCDD